MEFNEKNQNNPVTFGIKELMNRYDIGEKSAAKALRGIEFVNNGLALGHNRALWSEVELWERQRGRTPEGLKQPNNKESE